MSEMPGIGPVQGPQGPGEVRKAGRSAPASAKPADKSSDSVEISSPARIKAALGKVPEVRNDRVEEIRRQFKAGEYLTDDKINTAIDRLLKDLF